MIRQAAQGSFVQGFLNSFDGNRIREFEDFDVLQKMISPGAVKNPFRYVKGL